MTTPYRAERRPGETYQLFVLTALVIAVFGGFLLAVLIPLSRAAGWGWEEHKPEVVQMHGQLQLLGFAGLFVIGMSMRLLPRFAALRLRFPGLGWGIWALLLAALLVRAFVLPWLGDTAHSWVLLLSEVAVLAASAGFFLVIAGSVLLQRGGRPEAIGHFFVAGALILLLQGLAGVYVAVHQVRDGDLAEEEYPGMGGVTEPGEDEGAN